jgi:CubicO group peptidase (beta-lactamase class C family)
VTGPLGSVSRWPTRAAAGWISPGGEAEVTGPAEEAFAWASVTKVLTALAVWIAVEEGTVDWSDPAGPPGSTVGHLLAHASGLAPDSRTVLAPPGRRRIYSNAGIELLADHLGRASGMAFADYLVEAVIEPLGLRSTRLAGSPAYGASGSLTDLLRLAGELRRPTLVSAATLEKVTEVAFPGLAGVLPGFGSQSPNDWGLGVEIRSTKRPHWTGSLNSPATFGHFGRSGAFVWVDPVADSAAASVADRPFGPWAAEAWPALSDAILAGIGGGRPRPGSGGASPGTATGPRSASP